MWCIALIDLWMLSHPCIPGIDPIWSWCMILLIYCWIQFANILLRIFALTFFSDIGCHFLFLWHPCLVLPLNNGFSFLVLTLLFYVINFSIRMCVCVCVCVCVCTRTHAQFKTLASSSVNLIMLSAKLVLHFLFMSHIVIRSLICICVCVCIYICIYFHTH